MGSLLRSSLLIPHHHIPSVSRTNRQEIKRAIALLKCSIFAAYMVSTETSLAFPLFRGFQSTKEGSLGSPNWPRFHERGCRGVWWNEHCQAVRAPLGELLKRGIAFEQNLPEKIALISTNLYSSSGKLKGKQSVHSSDWRARKRVGSSQKLSPAEIGLSPQQLPW